MHMALISSKAGAIELERLIAGLLFVSESDSPLHVVQLGPLPELDAPSLLRALGRTEMPTVTQHSLGELFERTVTVQPWHGPAERATVGRYRVLLDFLSTALEAARVFRIGAIEVDAYALGKTSDGCWLGIATKLIET